MKTTGSYGALEDRIRRLELSTTHSEQVIVVSAVTLEEGEAVVTPTPTPSLQDHTHVRHEVPTGSGTSWALLVSPVSGSDEVYVNGLQLRRVASSPGLGEYSISGAAITTGFALGGSDAIWAHYEVSTGSVHAHLLHQGLTALGGPDYLLPSTPLSGSEEIYVNGVQLRPVVSGPLPGEYAITGSAVTLGWTLDVGDRVWAHYLI